MSSRLGGGSRRLCRTICGRLIQRRHLHLQGGQAQAILQSFNIPIAKTGPARITLPTPKIGRSDDTTEVRENRGEAAKWYLALTIDREKYCPSIVVAQHQNTTTNSSDKDHVTSNLHSFPIAYDSGITADLSNKVAADLGISSSGVKTQLHDLLSSLYQLFTTKDATHLEITHLSLSQNTLTSFSSSLSFDPAALSRQPSLSTFSPTNFVPEEIEAASHGLVYIKLSNNNNNNNNNNGSENMVGTVVNGAGLAMATNDAIGLYGGKSANFLDAGGQATRETMQKALGIVLADERIKAILVNIYGGITKCDMIAESIIGAAAELGPLRVPLVVRLQGTNSAEGLKLLEDADLGLHVEANFGEAARKAVQLAKEAIISEC